MSTTTMINPFTADPGAATVTTRLASGDAGPLIAVYASLRLQANVADPFPRYGLPFLSWVLQTLDSPPTRVAATQSQAEGFALWSAIITCASGLRLSLDIGHGFGSAQLDPIEIRAEWSGERQVIAYEPNRVGVSIVTASGASRKSASVVPLADALTAASPGVDPLAEEIVVAIREAAHSGRVVVRGYGPDA